MAISKPYYRIIRPFFPHGDPEIYFAHYWYICHKPYVLDARYGDDRSELWRAYMLIEKDLLRLFEYIEPTDDNLSAYSHRTYELLLRAATEFETNCKRILLANGYEKEGTLNVTDYFKVNRSSRLGDYSVSLMEWYPEPKSLKPFETWNSETFSPLPWYQSYNQVKHDRNLNFPRASLENVVNAVAGLYVVLFSQFFVINKVSAGSNMDSLYEYRHLFNEETMSKWGDIFQVCPPYNWSDDELYDFDWDTLKDSPDPFAKFPF
jgi:hypothetical protein